MNLEFNEADHTYKINGIFVPGCTTVTGILPKDWAMPWVAKETVKYILEKLEGKFDGPFLHGKIEDEIKRIVMDGKNAWRRKAESAAISGTTAHDYIEHYIKSQMGQEMFPPELPKDLAARNAIELFLRWEMQNQVKWLHSEIVVGSEKHMYGGKFDAVALVNGLVTLIDFKTSSGIRGEYSYQLSGYLNAYEEMEKAPCVAQRMVLWIPKTGNDFLGKIVQTPHTHDLEVFLTALQLYKALKKSELLLETA